MFVHSTGVNPVSTTLSSSPSSGGTTFTITSATGLPTIPTGHFGTARINDAGASAENIVYTRSGTTITLANSTTLANAHSSGEAIDFDVISAAAIPALKDDAISGYPENALTGAGALVKGTGVTNRITITSADATFTLADGSYKGEVCRIVMDRTCTKLATIDPASTTTIDGSTTRIMWAGETALLAWTGTEWNKIAGKSLPMIASVKLGTNITPVVNNTITAVAIDTTVIDNTGLMAVPASNKITCKRPGRYAVVPIACMAAGTSAIPNFQVYAQNQTGSVNIGATADGMLDAHFKSGGAMEIATLAVNDDIKLMYHQNGGQTTPTLVANLCSLLVQEVLEW